jgi:hypothetical protein
MQDEQRTLVRNYEGEFFEYPEPGNHVATWSSTPSNRLSMIWEPGAKW